MKLKIFLLLLFPLTLCAAGDLAYQKYHEGEQATDTEVRKKAFNEALMLYLKEEGANSSSALSYDIANTYYQLHEYGYAILYYYKALKADPRNQLAFTNLQIALQKAGLPIDVPNAAQKYLLFFHFMLSHNEKVTTTLILLLLAFSFFSMHLWMHQDYLKKVGIYCLWAVVPFLGSLLYLDNFSEPQAIVVQPSALRRDAGDQYATIPSNPALAGMKVTVLSVKADGNWLLVRLPSGTEGYLPKEAARLV